MNTVTKRTVTVSALIAFSALAVTDKVDAQEAVLVYASNVTANQSLNDISTQVTPHMLARDYTNELIAEMNVRLPGEHADSLEKRRIKDKFKDAVLEDLEVRLKQEIDILAAGITD